MAVVSLGPFAVTAPALPTELVPLGKVSRGAMRTHTPAPERVADFARSIAHCGLVVPLLAERRGDTYHVHSGHTRLAALHQLKDDRRLSELAQRNGVDVDHVPVRLCPGNERHHRLMALVENVHREALNPVDEALRVQQLLLDDEAQADVEHCIGPHRMRQLAQVLQLPAEVQQLLKRGRVDMEVALRYAKAYTKPTQLVLALRRMLAKEAVLHRRTVPAATLRQEPKHPTPMKVINALAAELHKAPQGYELLLSALHGLQKRMPAAEILAALSGAGIEAPEMKKRGRPRKVPTIPYT